jgi:hypothetical protein
VWVCERESERDIECVCMCEKEREREIVKEREGEREKKVYKVSGLFFILLLKFKSFKSSCQRQPQTEKRYIKEEKRKNIQL